MKLAKISYSMVQHVKSGLQQRNSTPAKRIPPKFLRLNLSSMIFDKEIFPSTNIMAFSLTIGNSWMCSKNIIGLSR